MVQSTHPTAVKWVNARPKSVLVRRQETRVAHHREINKY